MNERVKMTKGKVGIRIGRVSCNRQEGYISIAIEDEASSIRIVEIEMSFQQFAEAITGLSVNDLPAEFGNLDLIGKNLEVKQEYVPLGYGNFNTFEEVIKPYEVDGWVADREKSINMHKVGKKGYEVIFRRYV